MQTLQTQIKTLLQESFLVSRDTKKEILGNIKTLAKPQLKKIVDLLTDAKKQQEKFLEQAIANNPDLENQLHTLWTQGMKEKRRDDEQKEHTREEKILDKLEKELFAY